MSGRRPALAVISVALAVAVIVLLVARGGDDGGETREGADPMPSATTERPVVSDRTWCAGWLDVVSAQGKYVADPSPATSAAVVEAVGALRTLGVPESLDPSGHTELTAVLDDIQASVDQSFTPSVLPSEPADVAPEGEDHEHGHEEHGRDAGDAPFGAWLAEHCS